MLGDQFQRYNRVFRGIILLSFLASLLDCVFPFIFPDFEFALETADGVQFLEIQDIPIQQLSILALIFSVTPILWILALWQLLGISRIWKTGELINQEIGNYFKRFSYAILAIFCVETGLDFVVDTIFYNWGYLTEFPDFYLEDILFFIDLPFLVASIFLIMGSKAMSVMIEVKEESDLTI